MTSVCFNKRETEQQLFHLSLFTEGNGVTCGGVASSTINFYTDPLTCCQNNLFWLLDKFCEAESLGSTCYAGTGKFYRGDATGSKVCVRDCAEDSECFLLCSLPPMNRLANHT